MIENIGLAFLVKCVIDAALIFGIGYGMWMQKQLDKEQKNKKKK